jgi:hypothetical protein
MMLLTGRIIFSYLNDFSFFFSEKYPPNVAGHGQNNKSKM